MDVCMSVSIPARMEMTNLSTFDCIAIVEKKNAIPDIHVVR